MSEGSKMGRNKSDTAVTPQRFTSNAMNTENSNLQRHKQKFCYNIQLPSSHSQKSVELPALINNDRQTNMRGVLCHFPVTVVGRHIAAGDLSEQSEKRGGWRSAAATTRVVGVWRHSRYQR